MTIHRLAGLTITLFATLLVALANLASAAEVPVPETTVLRVGKVVIEKNVVFGQTGDRPLRLDILRPAETPDNPLPVIVWIHGGAWRAGNKSGGHVTLYPFAASGKYFTVSVGYRLSGEAIWPAQIHDCKAAIRWLRANAGRLNVNPNRIGVWGSSAGGHLVSMLGTTGDVEHLEGNCGSTGHSSRVTCVVDFCGTADLIAQEEEVLAKNNDTIEKVDSPLAQLLGGRVLREKRELAKQASPVTHVSDDDPPFLIMHGTNDPVVPFGQAEVLDEALRKANVESTFVRIIDGGHHFRCLDVTQRVSDFFDKHLLGRAVRVSGEPIIEPHSVARKLLAKLVGTWRGKRGVFAWQWGGENTCVTRTETRRDGSQMLVGLIVFDPGSGGLIDRTVSPWGNIEIHYTEFSDTQWRGKSTFTNDDGTVYTGTFVLDWTGPDELQVTVTNRLANGILPQVDFARNYRRIADEPKSDETR